MLWLNPNKIMSHYIIIISSFWLKCICDFLFSKVNPQSGILKNISLPLLWLPSSRSGSVSLDLEGDLPPTRKRWSPEPEKEASISFSSVWHNCDGWWYYYQDWLDEDGSCYSLTRKHPIRDRKDRFGKRFLLLGLFLTWDPIKIFLGGKSVNVNLIQLIFQPSIPWYSILVLLPW